MTETLSDPVPPPAPPPAAPPVPLRRRSDDRLVAGVCGAVGRATGTDPVLWRVVVTVLALFGGAGLALYAAGWLLIPKDGEDRSPGQRLLSGGRLTAGGVAVIVLLVLLGAVVASDGRGVAAVLVLALVGYLVVKERESRPVPVGPLVAPTADPPTGPLPADWGTPAWGAPAPAAPPRERSALGPVVLALTALVAGLLLAVRLAGVEQLTAPRILATCLVVVATGLVVGAFAGRARWLFFFPGLPLVLALAVAVGVESAGGLVGGGVGERTWLVAGGAPTQHYELTAGEATLDLRGADTSGRLLRVRAEVGAGSLLVIVPEDLTVRLRAHVGLGEIDDGTTDVLEGPDLDREVVLGNGSGDVEAELDLSVGAGEVRVRRG